MPPRLIDEDTPVRDEDDAAREDAEFAFVRGRGECIKGDVDCRGALPDPVGRSSAGGHLLSVSTSSARRRCQR